MEQKQQKKKKGRYKSGLKELRKSRKRYLANRLFKEKIKEVEIKIKNAVFDKKKELAEELLKEAYSLLDKAAKKRIFHPNKSARIKSQISKLVNTLSLPT